MSTTGSTFWTGIRPIGVCGGVDSGGVVAVPPEAESRDAAAGEEALVTSQRYRLTLLDAPGPTSVLEPSLVCRTHPWRDQVPQTGARQAGVGHPHT
ncbi:hypothetical protein BN13_100070 [Nostocoides jenkinsii Ben 74]|uniref:Uncharacterized protein n=1 Tax=Nostocoides jenkinsii Ben 74 TaxID=1193518 RepID=A0A077M2W1_9MICO|nr:hypothetical protein BN13_100070 [Tetrasphaera jenkinsii Ben 74]